MNQYANIITKNNCNNLCNIAMINLKNCVSELNIMQNNFNEICKDTVNYFDTNELEENESKWINRLINLSEYYLENNASKYFNREDVYVYIEKKKNYLLKNTCSILEKIKHDYSFDIIKPKKIIYKNDVKTLPIGIRNFNLNNENDSINLIQSLIELDEIKLEYILIIIVNSDGRALPNGIRINTNLFKEITSYIESGLATEINTKPLPYEITKEHILYLEEEIEIVDKSSNNTTNIDLFLLYLWEYSRYKSIMNVVVPYKDEEIYLTKKMKYIKSSIIESLNLIIETCQFYDIDTLVKLKENIVDGDMEFNDNDLNYYINKFCITQY